jgi:uncharacterized membrane protein YhaH (DUF805 family)
VSSGAGPDCYRPFPWQWRGRIGRVRFLAYLFPVALVCLWLLYLTNKHILDVGEGWFEHAVRFLVPVGLSIVPVSRRLNDIGLPWKPALVLPVALVLAPLPSLVLLYLLLGVYPGERQANRFGPPACANTALTAAGACLWIGLVGWVAWFLNALANAYY